MSEGNWDTYSKFTKNTVPFGEFIIPVRGFSTDVVGQIAVQTQHLDLLSLTAIIPTKRPTGMPTSSFSSRAPLWSFMTGAGRKV
jgi:hypothetical protein